MLIRQYMITFLTQVVLDYMMLLPSMGCVKAYVMFFCLVFIGSVVLPC